MSRIDTTAIEVDLITSPLEPSLKSDDELSILSENRTYEPASLPADTNRLESVASNEPEAEAVAEMRPAAQAVWKTCLELIRPQLSAQTVRTWFEPIEAIGLSGSELILGAPSSFFCEWITEHYQPIVDKALRDVLGASAKLSFKASNDIQGLEAKLEVARPATIPEVQRTPVQPDQPAAIFRQPSPNAQSPAPSAIPSAMPHAHQAAPIGFGIPLNQPSHGFPASGQKRQNFESNLNPRYTFDTFIRGESNKLAYAAAMAVANNPGGTRYNPLVIYGNVGLGKTHLIQAVGNAVIVKYSGARVLYTSSDRFTVEFVDAVQNNRTSEFQALYRSIDVLIIDDVQFFAGKERTQDIFFHSFNALREQGKQIILTCDRPPKELKDIDDRLLNRLQWGLTADIAAPDLETRIAILRHKALSDGIELPSEVIEFIATNVTSNIRELEGCLISLLATASLEGREPTIEVAKDVLRKVAKRSSPILTIETIQRTVAKKFTIEEELLRAKTRKQEVVQARQVAMYLCKELTTSSLKTIGLHFGGRDHSTVIHACQTVSDDIRHNAELMSKVEELRRQFELLQ